MARSNREMRLTEAHLALLPARIDTAGPPPAVGELPDSYYAATAAALIDALPSDGEMWLFAFGSLLWNKVGSEGIQPGQGFCLLIDAWSVAV